MTVVVAYLPTPEGREALDFAAREAVSRAVQLVVVGDRTADNDADYARVAAMSGLRVVEEQSTGDLAEDLVMIAERHAAQLVVIGLRRRSPVGKLNLGSNAQRILLDAPCPVLAVKPSRG